MANTLTAAEELEYVRSFKAAKMTGIRRSQLLAWEREGKLKIFRPSQKMALIRWRDLVALIEGDRTVEPLTA
jgi:predicted site-specific integrase-resolvase